MTKEVMVTLSGLQLAEGEQDTIELVHVGEYYEKNGTRYVFFEELLEGISQPVKNTIKIRDHYLEVQKRGAVTTNLIFEEGKTQSSTYHIPFGSFLITTNTTGVQVREEDELLEVTATYELHFNGQHCADCDIQVKIVPRERFRL